jgi:hypothetical protein
VYSVPPRSVLNFNTQLHDWILLNQISFISISPEFNGSFITPPPGGVSVDPAGRIRLRQKEELMKTISRVMTMTVSAGIFATLLVSKATAGCGDVTNWRGPFEFVQASGEAHLLQQSTEAQSASAQGLGGASIVGMWKIQFVSKGNVNHNPSIPDGAVIDFGYSQWHNDGTEILNSGGRAPATENFCLGVWGKTGHRAFELNHFALSYDSVTGMLNAKVNIREQVTLSPSGDLYTGTFSIDAYDPKGNHVDHVVGTVTGQRITVDSTLP